MQNRLLALCSLVLGCFSLAAGQIPEMTGSWAQGGPYFVTALKDKLIVLYYFEEG